MNPKRWIAFGWCMPEESCTSWPRLARPPIAAEAVRRIDGLFAIEREIGGRPPEERLAVRQERAQPLARRPRAPGCEAQQERVSRKSELAQGDRLRPDGTGRR